MRRQSGLDLNRILEKLWRRDRWMVRLSTILGLKLVTRVSKGLGSPEDVWAVFFAPSTAEIAIKALESFFTLPLREAASGSSINRQIKFAAIGPTTLKYLTETHWPAFDVSVVASSPTPPGLLEALLASGSQILR
jgi:hypothetical protein